MSEAFITRAGGSSSLSGNGMIGAFITENTTFTFNKTGNWCVTVIGGGGGGGGVNANMYHRDRYGHRGDGWRSWHWYNGSAGGGGGGGSGRFNSITRIFNKGDSYSIIIGEGGDGGYGTGTNGSSGGTTFFGNILSAIGGNGGGGDRFGFSDTSGDYYWGAGSAGYVNGNNGARGTYNSQSWDSDDGGTNSWGTYTDTNNFTGGMGGKLYILDLNVNTASGFECGSGGNGANSWVISGGNVTGVAVAGIKGINGGVTIRYLDEV